MARFTYSAEKRDGEIYKGVAEARDRFELYEVVRREGGKLVSLAEDNSQSMLSLRYWNVMLASVSEYDKVTLARNLGAMLSAGLSLARALTVISRQTKNLKLQDVLAEIESSVRRGDTLHDALKKFPKVFPPLFVAMIRAGEQSGDLAAALTLVADQMERMHNLKKKIRGAMMYPCIVLIAMIGIGALMMVSVVPTLSQTFREMNAELPAATKAIMGVSDFLVGNTQLALILALAFVSLSYLALKTKIGMRTSDFVFIKMPIVGPLVCEVNAARTARTMSSLLTAGVDVLTALDITGQVVQNSYFREVITDAQKKVGAGEPLSQSFIRREDLYPPFVGEMIAVGEETGQTSEMLKRLAIYYENEVDDKTKDMSTIIEPFLMLFIGGGVGFFAMAMIAPIYSLSENI